MQNWMLDYDEVKRRFLLNCDINKTHEKAISFDRLINIVSKYHMGKAETKKFNIPQNMNYNNDYKTKIEELEKLF